MSNSEAFVLGQAESKDRDALARVTQTAFLEDPLWQEIFRNVTTEDVIAFWAEMLSIRLETPDLLPTYKITEVATGNIVAWTCLKVPSSSTPGNFKTPDLPKGINLDLWQTLWPVPSAASNSFGYDSAQDFHRRGSHTHRDYQRQGHMRRLSQHCNAIADAAGAKTYAICREAAVALFVSEGYEMLGITTLDNGKYDKFFGREANHYVLLRNPKPTEVSIEL